MPHLTLLTLPFIFCRYVRTDMTGGAGLIDKQVRC